MGNHTVILSPSNNYKVPKMGKMNSNKIAQLEIISKVCVWLNKNK